MCISRRDYQGMTHASLMLPLPLQPAAALEVPVLFVALMSVILMGVFSVFGIILLLLVALPVLFLFALL